MGKGTRKRLDRQEKLQQQAQELAVQKKAAGRKRLLWIAVVAVAVLAIAAVLLLRLRNDLRLQNGDVIREQIVMSSEHFQVDGAMMSYFIHSEAMAYARANSNTLTMEGLDPDTDLKTQTRTENGSQTWFDYFADVAEENVRQYLRLTEGAQAAGLKLDADDEAYLDEQIETVRAQAKEENQTVEAFASAKFGLGVNLDDIRRAIDLQMLGAKLRPHLEQEVAATDEQLQAYYNENAAKLNTCDYYTITFVSSIEDGFTNDQILDYNAGTKRWADDLAKCHTMESFRAYLEGYYRMYYEDRGQEYDDAEIQASIDNTAKLVEEHIWTDDELSRWALDPSRQVGDTTVIEGTNEYSVYLITKAPTRLDYKTRDFRQIMLTKDTYETAVNMRDKANELRDRYEAGERTEAAFARLAEQYTDDANTKQAGGLCKNTRKGDTDAAVSAWLFDAARKAGDTRIIKSDDERYYLVYYVGEGEACWRVTAKEQMKAAAYNETYAALRANTQITVEQDAIATLPG
ncbi:MAG: peptidylprolyl isomerase [Clostridia bacterium]|nr:peptidylprolyl isomerase [Clostridia bacterium]